jgi:hypothetical protein
LPPALRKKFNNFQIQETRKQELGIGTIKLYFLGKLAASLADIDSGGRFDILNGPATSTAAAHHFKQSGLWLFDQIRGGTIALLTNHIFMNIPAHCTLHGVLGDRPTFHNQFFFGANNVDTHLSGDVRTQMLGASVQAKAEIFEVSPFVLASNFFKRDWLDMQFF